MVAGPPEETTIPSTTRCRGRHLEKQSISRTILQLCLLTEEYTWTGLREIGHFVLLDLGSVIDRHYRRLFQSNQGYFNVRSVRDQKEIFLCTLRLLYLMHRMVP